MVNKVNCLVVGMLFFTLQPLFSQTQIGSDIYGEKSDDRSGRVVALSSDGTRIAIGVPLNNGFDHDAGHVRIFDYDGSNWNQVGADIDGEGKDDFSGKAIALSLDGSRIIIGAPKNDGNGNDAGNVRIFDLTNDNWVQVGADIVGEAKFDESGTSVAISSDGNRIAIGAPLNDGNGNRSGQVRIFDLTNGNWIQVGGDIDGKAEVDLLGTSLAMSSDGNRIAVGAPLNDENGSNAGQVRIYQLNGGNWAQIGKDIGGEGVNDKAGSSISLSSDGNRIAIGTVNTSSRDGAGHVRVFELNGEDWMQVGEDIAGETAGEAAGKSVALSPDGKSLAIGAPLNNEGGFNYGLVRIFKIENENWTPFGSDITGTEFEGYLGSSLSFSLDGNKLAIGAPGNDWDLKINAGLVRVYELSMTVPIVNIEKIDKIEVFPNPTNGKINLLGIDYEMIKVVDSFGRTLLKEKQPKREIDLSNLSNGVYYFLIKSGNQLITKKIVKQ